MATRTLTDTATISWDEATANQVNGNVIDGSITAANDAGVPTGRSHGYIFG
jgi:hypothetical protein